MNDIYCIKEITGSEEKALHTHKILKELPEYQGGV